MTETKKIQTEIERLLNLKLRGGVEAKKEWKVTKERTDDYDSNLIYAPVIDIAIGPFLVNRVSHSEGEKLRDAFSLNQALIESIKSSGEVFSEFEYNRNPRCLIAVEIENSGSRKHLVGDIANASIFGKIGLIVPTNEANYRSFKRIMRYLEFAQKNNKINERIFNNIILIRYKDLIKTLELMENKNSKDEKMFSYREESNALIGHSLRNGFIEDLHAGTFPSSKKGDYSDVKVVSPYGEVSWKDISRISDEEMKRLMIEVTAKLASLLETRDKFPEQYKKFIDWMNSSYVKDWDK